MLPALPVTACSAPLAPPERIGRAARRVPPHHTASEPLDRSSPRTGFPVRIDRRNPCTLSGVAHREQLVKDTHLQLLLRKAIAAIIPATNPARILSWRN